LIAKGRKPTLNCFSADNVRQFPAFGFTEGAGFSNSHAIALLAFIFGIVCFVLGSFDDNFAVLGMGRTVFNGNNGGFIHFVAYDTPTLSFCAMGYLLTPYA